MNLLIVDDSMVIRNKINRLLERQFDVIGLADNGLMALRQMSKIRPDIVTMDLTMPQMDGVTCVREIMKLYPNTRILVISALADKATAISALALGANGFLCKPFTVEQLNHAMSQLMHMVKAS